MQPQQAAKEECGIQNVVGCTRGFYKMYLPTRNGAKVNKNEPEVICGRLGAVRCAAEPCISLIRATSGSTMRKGMEEKVEVALARFDRAVKESSIRSDQIGLEKGRRTQLLAEQPEDIASGIAVEARGGRPSGE